MHTVLVVIHVVSMIASVALMSGAIVAGLLGKLSAAQIATLGMITAVAGTLVGAVLLIFAPAVTECIILTSYLVGVTFLYQYGFGSGFAENARFIRDKG